MTEVPSPNELLALFDRAVRERPSSDGAPTIEDGPVVRVLYPGTGFVAAPSDTGLRGAELDELIRRQRDYFAQRGSSVEWKTYGYDRPADLTDRLRAAGFEPEDRETVLVGPSGSPSASVPVVPGVRIRETVADADLESIGRLHTRIWSSDWTWLAEDLRSRIAAVGPDGIRVFVAEADDELVSAAWLVMRAGSPFAGLWGGSTAEEWRGRGIYRALVARRATVAARYGHRYLQVDASDASRPILERLGFVALTTTTPYVWRP